METFADSSISDEAIFQVLQKAPDRRRESDLALLATNLRHFKAFDDYNDLQLRSLCRSVTYEYHPPNSYLYRRGELLTSSYVILHGSVMINSELYSVGSTIGTEKPHFRGTEKLHYRATDHCLVLDPTELLVISDEVEELDEKLIKSLIVEPPPPLSPGPSDSGVSTMGIGASIGAVTFASSTCDNSVSSSGYDSPSIQSNRGSAPRPLSFRSSSSSESIEARTSPKQLRSSPKQLHRSTTTKPRSSVACVSADGKNRRRSEADIRAEHRAPKISGLGMLQEEMQHLINRMGEKTHLGGVLMTPRPDTRAILARKRNEVARASTTEPPRLLFSSASVDIDDLPETCVDSDDDDPLGSMGGDVTTSSSRDSLSDIQDPVYESMEKLPKDRTPDDIDSMHDYLQYLPAFCGLTETIRRDLCAKMSLHKFLHGMEVVPNGRELSSWYVILYGQLELNNHGKNVKTLFSGEAFGITPEASKSIHQGSLVVKSDHCKILEVKGEDFKAILHSGEQNIRTVTENGQPVLVQEQRGTGDRVGYVIIRGTWKRLLDQLVESNPTDPNYAEDFLLCHRTFIEDASSVARQLLEGFEDVDSRQQAARVMLLWVNNHFGDFDGIPNMMDCLEEFRSKLEEERMGEHLRMLDVAVTTKAKARDVVLKRNDIATPLGLTIIGRNDHVYVSCVEKESPADQALVRVGDEILSVNDAITKEMPFERVECALKDGKKFRIQVKYAGIKVVMNPSGIPSITCSDEDSLSSSSPIPYLPPRSGSFTVHAPKMEKPHLKTRALSGFGGLLGKLTGRKQKPKARPSISAAFFSPSGQMTPPPFQSNREQTPDSETLSPVAIDDTPFLFSNGPVHHSISMPSIPLSPLPQLSSNIDYVIKVFRGGSSGGDNGAHCYIPVSNHTTAGNLVALAIREFALQETSADYSLCQIVSDSETRSLQQKRLPDMLDRLPDRLPLNARYYIKPHNQTGSLVQEEVVDEILRESAIHVTQLDLNELIRQLTLTDFETFHKIEPEEYIRDLFGCPGNASHLAEFAEVVNQEMFWVVTEVCRETRSSSRVKIIKRFIKMARLCRRAGNFNTMFALVSGLGHRCVQRLKATWDRVPSKYVRDFEALQRLMDPTRNMIKYRTVINEESRRGPVIPFFPVIKKDLMVLYLTNDSRVNGLINFEKLRKLSKEIRRVARYASTAYDPTHVFGVETPGAATSGELLLNPTGTLKKRSTSGSHSAVKKIYETKLMEKKVGKYISNLPVIDDEAVLEKLSSAREPPSGMNGSGHRGSIVPGRTSPQTRAMSVGARPAPAGRRNSATSPHMTRRLSVHDVTNPADGGSKKRLLGGSPFNKKRRGSMSSRQSLSCNNSPLARAKNPNH